MYYLKIHVLFNNTCEYLIVEYLITLENLVPFRPNPIYLHSEIFFSDISTKKINNILTKTHSSANLT